MSQSTDKTVETYPTFPSHYYFDAERYSAELEQIWYKNWVYVCRADRVSEPKVYRTFEIGSQSIIVLRDEHGELQAFHNTCRHRGSTLCVESQGSFETKSIVCPYHQWSYSLQGKLKGVPFIGSPEKLGKGEIKLYGVAVQEWGGCVFINLAEEPQPFEEALANELAILRNWPLDALSVGHVFEKTLDCNWKIFWENFQECYHCPGIHPELCDMVPLYTRAVTGSPYILDLQPKNNPNRPPLEPKLKDGAQTWSMNGQITGEAFHTLTEEEKRIGYSYFISLPNMFMAAHPDYILLVSLYPAGPETMLLRAEWLFPAATLEHPDFDLKNVTDFGTLVLEQDGSVCELNQKGLHSNRHQIGMLVPHELDVHLFLEWVRNQMTE